MEIKNMEMIDNVTLDEKECQIWTEQINGDHYVFFKNNAEWTYKIEFKFSGDNDNHSCVLNGRGSIFGARIHGVSFKKNFDIKIWNYEWIPDKGIHDIVEPCILQKKVSWY
jgi:hypothetical protein